MGGALWNSCYLPGRRPKCQLLSASTPRTDGSAMSHLWAKAGSAEISAQGSGEAHRIKRLPQKSKSPPIHLFEEMGSYLTMRGELDIGLRDPCVFSHCTGDRTLTLGVTVTDKR